MDTIYWLNPKKETLVIDESNSIALNTLTQIVIGPNFKVSWMFIVNKTLFLFQSLIPEGQASVLESLSVASFRINLIAPDKQVDIFCPLYAYISSS